MSLSTHLCKTPTCDGVVSSRSKSGLCFKCRSSLYYWSIPDNRTRIAERTHKLEFWQKRLTFFVRKVLGKI